MKVTKLQVKGYRNLKELELEPCDGVNIIYGENAQGKTNLIEAIWLFSGMKSFRGAKDNELIGFDASFSKLYMEFSNSVRENKASITVEQKKTATLNGVKLRSAVGLLGKFSAVVFAPSFLSIVKSGPEERRKFIDSAICQLKPAYAAVLTEYNKLMKQRNSLLHDVTYESSLFDMLDIIDEKMSQTGENITRERNAYLELLTPEVSSVYSGLSSGKEEIGFQYISRYKESAASLKEAFQNNRKEDILNRTTSVGPHRDDIDIFINGVSARAFGSQGQQRSCALALKFGESAILKNHTGEQPVILLDDVMSELDSNRQDFILNHIGNRQVFITCCEPEPVVRLSGGKKIEVKEGRISVCT